MNNPSVISPEPLPQTCPQSGQALIHHPRFIFCMCNQHLDTESTFSERLRPTVTYRSQSNLDILVTNGSTLPRWHPLLFFLLRPPFVVGLEGQTGGPTPSRPQVANKGTSCCGGPASTVVPSRDWITEQFAMRANRCLSAPNSHERVSKPFFLCCNSSEPKHWALVHDCPPTG